ncbi:MAG: hypothetical protein U1B94_05330 [candidate division NC10 bacterium]|nr:hypothetical protein [candidate division NC10 bacterium]
MSWGEWFPRLAALVGRARSRRRSPGSIEAYRSEIRRLEGEREALRVRRGEEEAAFDARHAIRDQFPHDGGLPPAEVERRLANLRRVREERLKAQEEACERKIRALERELEERFG